MNEKLITDFMQLGCKSRKEAAMTLQVYLELWEVKKYWDVDYKYDEVINCLYLTAKKSQSAQSSIFVAVANSDKLSFKELQKYLALSKDEENISINLVICTSDSTCIYYQITDGICEPPLAVPNISRENKREKLDKEIRKNRTFLEQGAMYGLAITLPKENKTYDNASDTYDD